MKLTIQTDELSRALYRVQGIADKKSHMPVLAHVLLAAGDDGVLTVSATDLDVGLSGTYKAEVEVPGSVAVHARQLYEVVKSLSSDTLHLERQDNNWIHIHSGSSKFRLVGMAADEFPALPKYSQITTFKISSKILQKMIDRTIFCVSTDDNRHNLSGIYCEAFEGKTLRMVSTDGHRLAMAETTLEHDIDIASGVIVPRKGFAELRRVIADTSNIDEVEIGFSETNGVLIAGSVVLSTRLVEGKFPEYNQVIPQKSERQVKVATADFANALRRVSLLSQSRAHGVKLVLKPGNLELVAEDPEIGTANEAIDVDYDDGELTVGFNAKYILDVLALISDQGVCFSFTDDLSPGVITPIEEGGFLAVVMPMRI